MGQEGTGVTLAILCSEAKEPGLYSKIDDQRGTMSPGKDLFEICCDYFVSFKFDIIIFSMYYVLCAFAHVCAFLVICD